METTVLSVLRKACDLVGSGQSLGIIEAISSLRDQTSGRTRDLAYYAVLETAMISRGDASLAMLAGDTQAESATELLEATIRRIMSALH
ncbi:hypothetical protein [Microvirga lotononidis]|uniref:Uncharacterized protein n=1 Tax=Microvirga lotononidis TaxID=864069 RepID=I4YV83_9HYPH|nr:hypothetical protein [Microvirga lotononidis]EIM27875.1 hypothetical protein MicloDRAFT_00044500 [Microvirga lotononidis]WQO27996.1 hypothetical protein U0023_02510 [Microvirga lotononidis]